MNAYHSLLKRQLRRLLAAMYRTCAHPHCQVGFSQCRIHHIDWFANGGHTVRTDRQTERQTAAAASVRLTPLIAVKRFGF